MNDSTIMNALDKRVFFI